MRSSTPPTLHVVAIVAATTCGPVSVAAQRLGRYNLWVCPHCERGTVSADASDLSCESGSADSGGMHWPGVKQALYRFLRSLHVGSLPQDDADMRFLMNLISAPLSGECYLGIMALGFFSMPFMDQKERRNFMQETVFGGVTFQRAIPLSYWDVYLSGWPIFGLLAAASLTAQHDAEYATDASAAAGALGGGTGGDATEVWRGLTGIELRPRSCCDFPGGAVSVEDRSFLGALREGVGSFAWVNGGASVPVPVSLRYLADSAHRNCSWGRAAAYFALAEALLVGSDSAWRWNATRDIFTVGEHNLDRCEANTTVYHLMLSVWPFWQILGRLEQRRIPVDDRSSAALFVAVGGSTWTPPASPASVVKLKWRHHARSRGLATPEFDEVPPRPGRPLVGSHTNEAAACMAAPSGLVHIALSADKAQIDGLIVTLNSATINAGENASRLCFHTFVVPHQMQYVVEALSCAFGANMTSLPPPAAAGDAVAGAFSLRGAARLLLHTLDSGRVWREVGLAPATTTLPSGASSLGADGVVPDSIELGDAAFRSDTGNLGSVHNFARFVLHELLPALPRVVYLDVDIVVRGDLCELYDTPLLSSGSGGSGVDTIAAVRRSNQPLRVYVDVLQPAVPTWIPSEAPSFNAGVMVVDLERWRKRHVSRLIAEWIATNRKRQIWRGGTQPPLLLLFHDEVAPLDRSWNVDGLGHRLNYPKEVLRHARVLHWTGPLKPWKHHGVNRYLWEPYTLEYCPQYSSREHTTTCRPDSWFC